MLLLPSTVGRYCNQDRRPAKKQIQLAPGECDPNVVTDSASAEIHLLFHGAPWSTLGSVYAMGIAGHYEKVASPHNSHNNNLNKQ